MRDPLPASPIDAPRLSYSPHDVLEPDEVRLALHIDSDAKWEDVRARIPWSEALGARTLRIQWGRLLAWLGEHEKRVA